jgi:DNA-directed RNA polymerase subunit RPC12/RpoP
MNTEINFDCAGCGQSIAAPASMGGQEINCPTCGRVLVVPKAAPTGGVLPVPEHRKLSETAFILKIAAACSAVIGLFTLVSALSNRISGDSPEGALQWAQGLLGLAVLLFFFAQLYYIRSSLDRRNS